MALGESVLHVFNLSGHRGFYQDFFCSKLSLQPMVGPITWALGARLVGCRRLLFATIGPNTAARAVVVAFLRACVGKRTVAICMQRDWYGDEDRRGLASISLRLFRFLDSWGKFKVYIIIPYELKPEAAASTSGAILDPCCWDQLDGAVSRMASETALSLEIKKLAAGRKIMMFLGEANKRKGYSELAPLAPKFKDQALIVSAGVVASECKQDAVTLREAGMRVEDRRISDEELLSLYAIADHIWCNYHESSNELSSGIFGRAVQLGKSVVVRKGSYLDRLAGYLEYPVLHELDQVLAGTGAGSASRSEPLHPNLERAHERLRQMGDQSLETLRCSL